MSVTLTRYLYNLEEVKLSYLIALLNKDLDRAYYWMFEMYYSGYGREAFEMNQVLYANVYVYRSNIAKKFKDEFDAWSLDQDPLYLATVVKNMIRQPIRISRFIGKIWNIKHVKDTVIPAPPKAYIRATQREIDEFETLDGNPVTVLKRAVKYTINKEFNEMFLIPTLTREDWALNWLVYAKNTPVWKQRLKEYTTPDGKEFASDEKHEEFYDKYGYEPDEQCVEVQEKIHGKPDDKYNYLNIDILCRFYHGSYDNKVDQSK